MRAPVAGAGVKVVGAKVGDGAGVWHSATSATCTTPHDVEAHGVLENAEPRPRFRPRAREQGAILSSLPLQLQLRNGPDLSISQDVGK